MKMFKRLAAVLLAGAMVLAMLTACGSGKGQEKEVEEVYMKIFNTLFECDPELTNDSTIEAAAVKLVTEKVGDKGEVADPEDFFQPDKSDLYLMIAPLNETTAAGITSDELAQYTDAKIAAEAQALKAQLKVQLEALSNRTMTDEQFNQEFSMLKQYITAAGVGAVQKDDGKYYVAMGAQLSNLPQP